MASRLFSCLGSKHDSSCWTVKPCESWVLVTSWKPFLSTCDGDVIRQGIPRYSKHNLLLLLKVTHSSPSSFSRRHIGHTWQYETFCLSEDRLYKPLQFYNVCFDTKHENSILLSKEWHADYLISPTLSTFLMKFIYHLFIQSLERGIHLEVERPSRYLIFVKISFEIINYCDFCMALHFIIIKSFRSVIRR